MEILEVQKGDKAFKEFDNTVEYIRRTNYTMDYFTHRKTVIEDCQLKAPEVGSLDFKNVNKLQLIQEFIRLYEEGKVNDVHEFAEMLKSYGHFKAFYTVVTENPPFDKMLEHLQEEQLRS